MIKNRFRNVLILAFSFVLLTSFSESGKAEINVLVVRGGHPYDTPEFEEMCQSLEDINVDLVLTAHMQSMKAEEIAKNYDAILFLNQNKHYPEYERNKKQYMDLAQLGVGMVFLHFTLSSQPEWDGYHDLVGGKWFLKSFTEDKSLHSTYFTDITLDIKVLDPDHQVTAGLKNFNLTDVFYGNIYIDPSVHPLLGVDHPDISEIVAWAHTYENSKVVYVMPGYSKKAYENMYYRKLITNALKFVSEGEGN